jgi:hypothetical protein
MNVEHWWNNADKANPKYLDINLPHYHVVGNKLRMGLGA